MAHLIRLNTPKGPIIIDAASIIAVLPGDPDKPECSIMVSGFPDLVEVKEGTDAVFDLVNDDEPKDKKQKL
jgi:hypothetical protein